MGKRRRLRGGEILVVLCVFAAFVAVFIGLVIGVKRRQAQVDFEADYYFLVENCEDSTAAAVMGQVHSAGGAGYLLRGEGVVVACYFSVRDAERVQAAMLEKGVDTRVTAVSARKFYLTGDRAAYAASVEANAATVESCARLLYDVANGLERAEIGQSAARTAVRGVGDSLAGLRMGNTDSFFDRWNAELVAVERECREISDGIVFARDLRRVQARLLSAVILLDTYF